MRQTCCKDAVQLQTARGNVAKWVTILIASSAHERNWDIPKNASRISQTTARTDSWTPHSNGITTATAAHTSQTHMDLDALPFQLNLFFVSQGCCSGSEPSSSRLLHSNAKRCAASPPIVSRNSLAPIRSSSVKWHAVGALCSWLVGYKCDACNQAVSHPRGRPLADLASVASPKFSPPRPSLMARVRTLCNKITRVLVPCDGSLCKHHCDSAW